MKHISELTKLLSQNFMWGKPRVDCFAKMLLALIVCRAVNLTKVASFIGSKAKLSSRYRRLQRFFQLFRIDLNVVARFIWQLFGFDKVYLTMNRTNWKWGKSHINILMLGVVYKGTAIPLFWKLLGKAGNSDTEDRIAIVTKFLKLFGKEAILGLLADREFVGKEWFGWLTDKKILFYIRIKNNTVTTNSRGLEVDIRALFNGLSKGEQRVLKGLRKVYDNRVHLAGLHTPKGELLIVATNLGPEEAIRIYAKRWEIETLFGCLKGRGFCFEDTHMVNGEKISQLIVLLAIAFSWAYKTGIWVHEKQEEIKVKKHGRLSVSFFRRGLDYIREELNRVFFSIRRKLTCIEHLSPFSNPSTRRREALG